MLKEILNNLKYFLFKKTDILTGNELEGSKELSYDTEKKFIKMKNLRNFNNIYYIWDYNDTFKKLIFSYKYKKRKNLSNIIANLINEELEFVIKKEKIDIIVTVPVSNRRLNERGFNQVDEILNSLKLSYISVKRIKDTKKMHEILNEEGRVKNIKNSFYIPTNVDLNNKNILIFDDIITTGATLRELKKEICRDHKDVHVAVFCLAAAREIRINKGEI